MIKYKDMEKYLANMFTAMLGNQATEFGFSDNENERVLAERQNGAPIPDASTVLTFRLDGYNTWRAQRYGRGTIGYDKYGQEVISELRTIRCIVNVMSKQLGDAFDSSRFIIANLQNNRYNDFVNRNGRMFGIEQIYRMRNLSDLENGTWTERISFEVQLSFKEKIVVNDQTLFVKPVGDPSDVKNSVSITTTITK